MKNEELFKEKAASGYTVCCVDTCPLREECLRWLVWQQMPATRATFSCVNPKYESVGTECSKLFIYSYSGGENMAVIYN